MKKYIFGVVLSLGILVSPAFTQAKSLTGEQIQSILSFLSSFGADSATIASVSKALTGSTSATGANQTAQAQAFCHDFNSDLSIGSSGDDVSALNQALSSSGIDTTGNTSLFVENTAADVRAFQAKYGIRQTGYVGPKTRAKLNELYGCPSITISRTPATSQTNPYKVGDATTFSSISSPSFFSTDQQITRYNQIGASTPRTFTASTSALRDNGSCNATTGACTIPGNWDASAFTCPAGVTDTQQMTEWYTIGNTTSNKITWYFQCSVTTPASSYAPVGSLSGIDTSGIATGWAVDPDATSTSISVHFYIDGAAGAGGTYAGSAVADIASTTVNDLGYQGNHGFSWQIPSQWQDGKLHTLYVHGIDLSGDDSKNVLLSNVPKSFTLGTATAQPITLKSISPTSGPVGAQVTLDGCGSDSTSGFTLVYTGTKSGSNALSVTQVDGGCGNKSSDATKSMSFTVPSDFSAGTYTFSVKNNQTNAMSTNSMAFTVTPWTIVSSGGHISKRLQYVSPTLMYGIGLDNKIWKWTGGTTPKWTQVTTSGSIMDDFVLVDGSETNIYAIGLDNGIWHWDGTGWSPTSSWGKISKRLLYVSPTQMFGIGDDNGIWQWTKGDSGCGSACWTQIASAVKDDFVFVNNKKDNIYGIGMNNWIYHFANGAPDSTSPSAGYFQKRVVYVDPTHIYGIGQDDNIWRWNGTLGNWTQITSGAIVNDFVLVDGSETNIYAIGEDNQIWHWVGGLLQSHS